MALQGVNLGASKGRGLGQRPKPGACFLSGKERHFKWECSKAQTPPPRLCPICRGDHWRKDCPQRQRSLGSIPQAQDRDCGDPGLSTLAPVLITTQEFGVTLNVGRPPIDFLLDTGAPFSVLLPNPGPLPHESATRWHCCGISGKPVPKFFTQLLSCDWESIFFSTCFSDCSRAQLLF